jgi:YggT family protein
MIYILIQFINVFSNVLVILVIVHIILSYFMSPYHPLRLTVDRVVEPLLNPIRRVVPLIGMLDFSPLILILLVQLISSVLVYLLLSLR